MGVSLFLRTKKKTWSPSAVVGTVVSGIRFLLVADIEWLPRAFWNDLLPNVHCGTIQHRASIVSKMSPALSFNSWTVSTMNELCLTQGIIIDCLIFFLSRDSFCGKLNCRVVLFFFLWGLRLGADQWDSRTPFYSL